MEDTMSNQENTPSLEMDDSKNEKSDERKKFIRRPDLDVMQWHSDNEMNTT